MTALADVVGYSRCRGGVGPRMPELGQPMLDVELSVGVCESVRVEQFTGGHGALDHVDGWAARIVAVACAVHEDGVDAAGHGHLDCAQVTAGDARSRVAIRLRADYGRSNFFIGSAPVGSAKSMGATYASFRPDVC